MDNGTDQISPTEVVDLFRTAGGLAFFRLWLLERTNFFFCLGVEENIFTLKPGQEPLCKSSVNGRPPGWYWVRVEEFSNCKAGELSSLVNLVVFELLGIINGFDCSTNGSKYITNGSDNKLGGINDSEASAIDDMKLRS